MKKFNPNKNMRIPMEKAHISYTRGNKKKDIEARQANRDGFNIETRPSEFSLVPNLQAGKKKDNNTKEKLFDIKNDGKPFPKKKESKVAKMARAYYMVDGRKEYHEVK